MLQSHHMHASAALSIKDNSSNGWNARLVEGDLMAHMVFAPLAMLSSLPRPRFPGFGHHNWECHNIGGMMSWHAHQQLLHRGFQVISLVTDCD
jgi:hypothetical protein